VSSADHITQEMRKACMYKEMREELVRAKVVRQNTFKAQDVDDIDSRQILHQEHSNVEKK
jgi:hypothetical protein